MAHPATTTRPPARTERLRSAIARIQFRQATGKLRGRGTGTLVAPDLVLTAMHVVADRRSTSELVQMPGELMLWFPEHEPVAGAVVAEMWDADYDWALVRLAEPLLDVTPVPLGEVLDEQPEWRSFGFPAALGDGTSDGMWVDGEIVDPASRYDGIWTFQMFSRQAAAGSGAKVRGLSGAPILVDGAIVGVMRSSLMDDDKQNIAGTMYACPMTVIVEQVGALLPLPDSIRGLPGVPRRPLPGKPFRHLAWYTAEDAEIFFGRSAKIRELHDKLTAPDHEPVVLFYGPTGSGKSSLLAAGLGPRLQNHHTLYLRRKPRLGLVATLREGLGVAGNPDTTVGDAWRAMEADGRPLVVFVDQVEEAFTLSGKARRPAELTQLLSIAADELATPPIAGALVLAFRKEWLPEIETMAWDARVGYSKVFLEPMGREGVIDAVQGLTSTARLRDFYHLTLDEDLPDMIAGDLTRDAEAVVAPTLQVLLTRMWEVAKARDPQAPRFLADDYRTLQADGVLLSDFLTQQLRSVAMRLPLESRSGLALDVLAFHTTLRATARSRDYDELHDHYGHWEGLDGIIAALQDAWLLVGDPAVSTRLAHDTMAPLVRRAFAQSGHPGQLARRILDGRIDNWRQGKKGASLDRHDLYLVEQGRLGTRAWDADELRMIKASRVKRLFQRGTAVLIALGLIIALVLVSRARSEAADSLEEALAANLLAEDARVAAEAAEDLASENETAAVEAKGMADEATEKARAATRQAAVGQQVVLASKLAPDAPQLATMIAAAARADAEKHAKVHLLAAESALRLAASRAGGRVVAHLGDGAVITDVFVSGTNRRLITIDRQARVSIWSLSPDVSCSEPGQTLEATVFDGAVPGDPPPFALSANERWLVTPDMKDPSRAILWDLSEVGALTPVTLAATQEGHIKGIERLALSPDAKYIVAADGREFVLWARVGLDPPTYTVIGKRWQSTSEGPGVAERHDVIGPVEVTFSANGRQAVVAETGPRPVFLMFDLTTPGKLSLWRKRDRSGSHHWANPAIGKRSLMELLGALDQHGRGAVLASHDGKAKELTLAGSSPMGHWLLTSDAYGKADLWSCAGDKACKGLDRQLRVRAGSNWLFRFGPELPDRGTDLLVTDSDEGTAKVWRLPAPSDKAQTVSGYVLPGNQEELEHALIDPTGRWLATVVAGTDLQVWDLAAGGEVGRTEQTLSGHDAHITSLAFNQSPAQPLEGAEVDELDLELSSALEQPRTFLVAGATDGTVRLWDVPPQRDSGALERYAAPRGNATRDLALSPTDGTLVSISSPGRHMTETGQVVTLWSREDGAVVDDGLALTRDGEPSRVALDPTGQYVAIAGPTEVRLADVDGPGGLGETNQLFGLKGASQLLRFSPAGTWLLSALRHPGNGKVVIEAWNTATRKARTVQTVGTAIPNDAAIDPTGRWIITTGRDELPPRRWDTEGKVTELPVTLQAGSKRRVGAEFLRFSDDGDQLAWGRADGAVVLWDMSKAPAEPEPGRLVHTERFPVTGVVFSPNGRWLAIDDVREHVWLYDTQTHCMNRLEGVGDSSYVVRFGPDSRWVAAGSDSGFARVWDLQPFSGETRDCNDDPGSTDAPLLAGRPREFYSDPTSILALRLVKDPVVGDLKLLTGSTAGQIRIWDLDAAEYAADACERMARRLSPSEKLQFFGDADKADPCGRDPLAPVPARATAAGEPPAAPNDSPTTAPSP